MWKKTVTPWHGEGSSAEPCTYLLYPTFSWRCTPWTLLTVNNSPKTKDIYMYQFDCHLGEHLIKTETDFLHVMNFFFAKCHKNRCTGVGNYLWRDCLFKLSFFWIVLTVWHFWRLDAHGCPLRYKVTRQRLVFLWLLFRFDLGQWVLEEVVVWLLSAANSMLINCSAKWVNLNIIN